MSQPAFDASLEKKLQETARNIRMNIVRMVTAAQSGHPAGSLGMTDVFTYLYFHELHHKPQDHHWKDRDYLLLSNGHICPVLYASLAELGVLPNRTSLDLSLH